MLNRNYFLAFLAICLFAFSSCTKEDIDTTTTTDDENPVEVVVCDGFSLLLADNEGTISAEVTEGTAPYTFAWSTDESTDAITVDESGTYSLTVTDAEGCDTTSEITVEVAVVNECDNSLTLDAAGTTTPIMFSAQSEAHLWKGADCAENFSLYDHNYIVVDVDWNNWGTGEAYHITAITDGLPGISFGSNGMPAVGDVLTPYFVNNGSLFITDADDGFYNFDGTQITITETSNELGGQIAGTISGTIVEGNDPDNSSSISGSFCVSIASVCE